MAQMNAVANSLRVEGLACERGTRTLFRSLEFGLCAGEWLHVRGANGAGKTSLLRLLAGLAVPHEGAVRWNGVELPRAGDDFRSAVIYLGHRNGLKEDLSALENLRLAAALDGQHLGEVPVLRALSRMGLRGREDLPLRVLSQGQHRRALLARLLLRPAALWILDEPLSALDTGAVDLIGELVEAHLHAGGLAVLTSHQAIGLSGGRELDL